MSKLSKVEKLEAKWYDHEFSSGPYPGEDYLQFQKEARAALAEVAAEAGYVLYKFNKNHYEFSAVLQEKETGAFAYVSIADVRFFPREWGEHILYRRMKHETDWVGGPNHYSSLRMLAHDLQRLYA